MSSTPTHCTQCGEQLGEGFRFCLKCGAPVSMSPVERETLGLEPPLAPKKGVPAWVILLSIGCLLLLFAMLAAGGWFLYKKLHSTAALFTTPAEASQPASTEAPPPVQEHAAPAQ